MTPTEFCLQRGCAQVGADTSRCTTCGFYRREAARRKVLLEGGKLSKDPETGLLRLVFRRAKK